MTSTASSTSARRASEPSAGLAVLATGLRKRYGTRQALAGVDLHVDRGELVALLGPNGSGKTTTIEILEGFRTPDSGTVRVLGEDPATAGRRWRSRLGVVGQDSDDRAEVTVSEAVRDTARCYPDPVDPDGVIDAVGLRQQADVRVRRLSGGQRRRLDVARGIVGRPELLFLDEPTTGWDLRARHDFRDLCRRLRAAGTTILLTTHDLHEAAALADRVVVMLGGRVLAEGTPDTLGGQDARTPVVGWTVDGVEHGRRTPAPTALVSRLAAAVGHGGEIPDLCVTRPGLEDVYLALVGPEDVR
ncbi:ABC transporter ATP-binding protein [Isoptericola sp. b515]|uniref:ABC transporter ATP-binding protein n=1 Tax=Isoptericola sp. b515 TaxID=3064652 RepID=UPI002712D9DA|nr:ABC transporter ATP-binding protein [Isoptericola sp. b515]MDO8147064.1 ABC transporter ATP-binding protein [Isoptericola sp. b515]